MLLRLRAHAAAASVIVLLVGSLGPSAAAAADLIRGVTGCEFVGQVCPPAPASDGVLPGDTSLADGGLPGGTSTLPTDASVLPPSSTLPASMALPNLPGTPTLPGTSTLPGSTQVSAGTTPLPSGTTTPTTPPPVSTITPLPTLPDNPPSSDRPPPVIGDNGTPPMDVNSNGTETAAQKQGWGGAKYVENFNAGLNDWGVYNGAGHNNQGKRNPTAATVAAGVLTMNGDAQGTTAGLAWKVGARYGRWEVRMRAPAADPSYHAVALLWPDAEDWPVGGEVDFAEMSDPSRKTTQTFLHYGASNSQISGSVNIDATQWHNWAVEWTPTGITNYVDGVKWWSTTDVSKLPPRSMHLCLQLDWFPTGGAVKPSQMQVDWAAFYPVEGSGATTPPPNSGGTIPPTAAPTPTPSATPTPSVTPSPSTTPKPSATPTTSSTPTTSAGPTSSEAAASTTPTVTTTPAPTSKPAG